MAGLIVNIDKFSKWVGNIVCWILVPLIFAMTYEVLARKLFHAPTIWAYDISRFLYGALFMLGAGYALSKGVHIRADFLYRNFKKKKPRKNRLLVIYSFLFSWSYSISLYDYRLCR
jgi:TRAP-type mannitol/chloroaromatic compound transport system permease small subunit